MASLKRDVGRIHPELKETVEIFDRLAYRWQYSEVFDDMLDKMVGQHLLLPTEGSQEKEARFKKKYSPEEQQMFVKMYDNFIRLTKERVNLWADKDQRRATGWYDPLGSFYEEISSDGKKSAMGQFFTPEHIVTMMTQISMGADADHKIERGEMVTLAEPACGSGRFILAANAMHPGTFSCGNDLDVMCAKMTALNMCWNGAVGQVTCGDGLDITGESFRFGWAVVPMMVGMQQVKCNDPGEQALFDSHFKILSLMVPSIQKSYCLVPLEKAQCLIYRSDISRNLQPESQRTATTTKEYLDQLIF
jgi:type I restriction enzyme M protein